jgi:hypothetical protein
MPHARLCSGIEQTLSRARSNITLGPVRARKYSYGNGTNNKTDQDNDCAEPHRAASVTALVAIGADFLSVRPGGESDNYIGCRYKQTDDRTGKCQKLLDHIIVVLLRSLVPHR